MSTHFTSVRKNNIPLWRRWYAMTQRVEEKYDNYDHVKIHDDWNRDVVGAEQAFLNFHEDMGDDFDELLELDRIDPHGEYSSHNCRWVTKKVNLNNMRFHHTPRGMALNLAKQMYGDTQATKVRFWKRVKTGWSFQDAAEQPPHRGQQSRLKVKPHTKQTKQTKPKTHKKRTVWSVLKSII